MHININTHIGTYNMHFARKKQIRLARLIDRGVSDAHAGDLFDMLLPMLSIYQEYVRNHHYSLQVLTECKQSPSFAALLKRSEQKTACQGRSLETFLTYPMHQVMASLCYLASPPLQQSRFPYREARCCSVSPTRRAAWTIFSFARLKRSAMCATAAGELDNTL